MAKVRAEPLLHATSTRSRNGGSCMVRMIIAVRSNLVKILCPLRVISTLGSKCSSVLILALLYTSLQPRVILSFLIRWSFVSLFFLVNAYVR